MSNDNKSRILTDAEIGYCESNCATSNELLS